VWSRTRWSESASGRYALDSRFAGGAGFQWTTTEFSGSLLAGDRDTRSRPRAEGEKRHVRMRFVAWRANTRMWKGVAGHSLILMSGW